MVVSESFVRIGKEDARVLVETSNCSLQHPPTKEWDHKLGPPCWPLEKFDPESMPPFFLTSSGLCRGLGMAWCLRLNACFSQCDRNGCGSRCGACKCVSLWKASIDVELLPYWKLRVLN